MSGEASVVDRLVRELDRSFHGPTWHGPTLYEIVSNLDAQLASTRHHPDLHTIGELVGHAGVWKDVVRRRLEGEAWAPASEAENFPPLNEDRSWKTCLVQLSQSHQALVEVVARQDPQRLDRPMPAGGGSAFDQILGVIQHDLYHAGQAVILLKLVRGPGARA